MTPLGAMLAYLRRRAREAGAASLIPENRMWAEEWPDSQLASLARKGGKPALMIRGAGAFGRRGPMRIEERRVDQLIVAEDFLKASEADIQVMDWLDGFRVHRSEGDQLVAFTRIAGPNSWRHEDKRWPTIHTTWVACFQHDPPYRAS